MIVIQRKPKIALEACGNRAKAPGFQLERLATEAADQMVMGFGGVAQGKAQRVIRGDQLIQQPGAVQRLQRAVHRSRIQPGQPGSGLLIHLLRPSVSGEMGDGLQDHAPLGGHPEPRSAYLLLQVRATGHLQLLVSAWLCNWIVPRTALPRTRAYRSSPASAIE